MKKGSEVVVAFSTANACLLDGAPSLRVSISRVLFLDMSAHPGLVANDSLSVRLGFWNASASASSSALRPFLIANTRAVG